MKQKNWKYLGYLIALTLINSCELLEFNEIDPSISEPEVEVAFPGQTGEIVKFVVDDQVLECEKINGYYVFQGDILLTPTQLVEASGKKGSAVPSRFALWPEGKVYYKLSNDFPEKNRVTEAIQHWEDNTSLIFIEQTNQINYIEFDWRGSGCYSWLGMIGGPQTINIADWGMKGNVIHEIGHAVGLIHEHSRNDRDDYVQIHWENITEEYDHNFSLWNNSLNAGTFDFNSIMMYPSYAFSIDKNNPTITKLDGSTFSAQRSNLTESDIAIINKLYYYSEVFSAPFSSTDLLIDGQLNASEWSSANNYDITFERVDGVDQKSGSIYLQHDGTYLYVGVKTLNKDDWDGYLSIRIDGDNDQYLSGNSAEPHKDINVEYPAPGGWGGYIRYDYITMTETVPVTPPSGTQRASYGSTNVSYEFKIKIADLNMNSQNTIGFSLFNLTDGVVDHAYKFPINAELTNLSNWGSIEIQNYDRKSLPVVNTSSAYNISSNSANCDGAVTSDGGSPIMSKGICWSTNPEPNLDDSHTTEGKGQGTFSSSLNGLNPSTNYFVRAYATNSVGISYGNQVSFTTYPVTTHFEANYSSSTFMIDGQLNASEWSNAKNYDITFERVDGVDQKSGSIYLQHDGTYLYVGVKTLNKDDWDGYLSIRIDGNNDQYLSGNSAEPHKDINIEYPAPGGWGGYIRYDYITMSETVPVTPPSGTQRASYGSTNVSYEFKIKITDLNMNSQNTIGFSLFNLTDGVVDHAYKFPINAELTNLSNWGTIKLLNH